METERHHRIKKIIIAIIIIPIALFLALLIISFVANVFQRSQQIKQTQNPAYSGSDKTLIEGQNMQSFGAANPQLTIVEFADFACPFCKASFPAIRQTAIEHQDKIKVIFRDWPGHQYSVALANGAYCAGEQEKFWEMHDKLYQHQSDTFGSSKNDLAGLASELGIYNEQFRSCFDTQKYLPLIQKNFADSQTLQVRGTPTWFFNGKKVEGALTSDDLAKVIDAYLK